MMIQLQPDGARIGLPLGLLLVMLFLAQASASNDNYMLIPMADEIEDPPTLVLSASGVTLARQAYREAPSDTTRVMGPRIIMAVWDDGTIVWSNDRLKGGLPYLRAKIDPEQLEETVSSMCEIAGSIPSGARVDYRGPDSSWSTIYARSETCSIYWHSWHELSEASSKLVAVDGYLRPLAPGETTEEAREMYSSPEHRIFVDLWAELKSTALELIPEDPPEVEEVVLTFRAKRMTIESEE